MSECQTKAGNQISLSQSHSLSFTHSRHTEQLLFSCLCSKVTLSLSHSHTLSHSHYLTLSLSRSHSLIHSLSTCWTTFVFMSMLKSHILTLSYSLIHSLSRHAEQLLFSSLCSKHTVYCWKLQCFFFLALLLLSTLTCYFRCHRAGSQLKMSESQTKAGNQNIFKILKF